MTKETGGAARKLRRRKRSASFVEIAELAGVSISTVDRVLNERGSASEAARAKVIEASKKLGVPRILPDMRHGIVHFDVLMPLHDTPFSLRLNRAMDAAIRALDRRVQIHRHLIPLREVRDYVQAIRQPLYRRSGIIISSTAATPIRNALNAVIDAGEPVVTIHADIQGLRRAHYAGIDHRAAGATAGYWIGRLASGPGKVLILPGFADNPAHEDRVQGCTEWLAAEFPHLMPVRSAETRDHSDRGFRAVVRALEEGEVVGIYDTGYVTRGIVAALRKFSSGPRPVWIAHEMLDEHRDLLLDGSIDLVIDQDPDGQVRSAFEHLLFTAGLSTDRPAPSLLEFALFSKPNVRHAPY